MPMRGRALRARAPATGLAKSEDHWGALDLLPAGNRVLVAAPGFLNPVMDAAEIEVTGPNDGRVALAAGYDGYGEPVRLVRDETGAPIEF